MKIVVLDGYTENPGDLSWNGLESLGELTVYDRTQPDEIAARIRGAGAVYVNKVALDRETIFSAPDLKFIGVLATGYNVVDIAAARERGIAVCNIPTYGTAAVGQFAIAMLLEICHHVAHHSDAVHAGRWEQNADWCFWDYPLIELAGKTMGIIGFGRIGQTTGRIARALGMNVIAYDEYESGAGRALAEYTALDALFARSDVIALDVVSTEPIRGDNPLLKAKNCLITPHISWAPKESRQRLMEIAADNLRRFLEGSPVNVVNL